MKLSICMMVKNETKYLDNCLKSLQALRDAVDSELIIVDTGSEDDTVEIAKKYTDKVYFHKWNNDFSGMRNKTISYAKGDWILIFDADEVLQETEPIVNFLKFNKNKKIGAAAITGKSITNENNLADFSVMLTIRLFKHDGYFHFDGVVHNQPMFKGGVIELEASLLHYGYMSTDKELMEKKFLRTNVLLKNELEKDPENIYYWFQLSVSYGMHDEIDEAIKYIEKAYELFVKKGKPDDCMYVMTHFVHMNQLNRNYKKVEELCLESLEIKSGYLDIYYYLAESQTVLEKYQESIINFHKYLDLLATHNQLTAKDVAVSDYTVGIKDNAYYNLSILYRKTFNYELSLKYAQKIERAELIRQNFKNITYLFIKQGQYHELRNYYNTVVAADWYMLFYEKMAEVISEFDNDIKVAVAREFIDIDDNYGLLSRLIVEIPSGELSRVTVEQINKLDFLNIPLYCSDILYYLLQINYPLSPILTHFKEIWIKSLLDDILKRHDDVNIVLYKYLQKYNNGSTNSEYKLNKFLSYYALAIDKMTDDEYRQIFNSYVSNGISYMNHTYNSCIFVDELVYEVKNDEEVFFVYMNQAKINKAVDDSEYIKYLRKALESFSGMKKGILILLQDFEEEQAQQASKELQGQIKQTIEKFIEEGNLVQASALISEYELIVTNDSAVSSMKAIIAISENRLEDAEDVLYDALFWDTTNFDLYYNLAYVYEMWGKTTQAYQIYSNLLKENLKPENNSLLEEALQRLASTYNKQSKPLQELKILQGTIEIANQMYTMNDAMQKNGYNTKSINYYQSYLGYQNDLTIDYDDCKDYAEVCGKIDDFAKKAIREYDLFHFHYGKSLTLDNRDLYLLKMLDKKVIMNYWGSEVRQYSIARQYNPDVKVKNYDEEKIVDSLKKVAKDVDHCIVADWELYLYVKDIFKNVHFLPITIDINKYQPIKNNDVNKRILIVHAPTHQEVKGTKYIIEAVDELKEKYEFDFQLVEGLEHEEAKKIYQEADIIIDQLLIGSYGVFAIESMAMEKTVISWISDYMKDKYPETLPIVRANGQTIKAVLENLLNNVEQLTDINIKSRCYVNQYHSAEKVAEKLVAIYEIVAG